MAGAHNDIELARMLAPSVIRGLKIMGEEHLEPDIKDQIESRTHRGSVYHGGGAGSLSESWSTKSHVYRGYTMGMVETYYDSAKLAHDPWGRHQTPELSEEEYDGPIELVDDMATLIDQGLGGHLRYFINNNNDNPTWHPTYFWKEGVVPSFESNRRAWIKSGLTKAGLKVL